MKTYKSIKVSDWVHHRLKLLSVSERSTMDEMLLDLMNLHDTMSNKVFRCEFYKENDQGYLHEERYIKANEIPKLNDEVMLYYPDGMEYHKRKVVSVTFEDDVFEIICSHEIY